MMPCLQPQSTTMGCTIFYALAVFVKIKKKVLVRFYWIEMPLRWILYNFKNFELKFVRFDFDEETFTELRDSLEMSELRQVSGQKFIGNFTYINNLVDLDSKMFWTDFFSSVLRTPFTMRIIFGFFRFVIFVTNKRDDNNMNKFKMYLTCIGIVISNWNVIRSKRC